MKIVYKLTEKLYLALDWNLFFCKMKIMNCWSKEPLRRNRIENFCPSKFKICYHCTKEKRTYSWLENSLATLKTETFEEKNTKLSEHSIQVNCFFIENWLEP